jgi:hypothetical protein
VHLHIQAVYHSCNGARLGRCVENLTRIDVVPSEAIVDHPAEEKMIMGVLRVISRRGDDRVTWVSTKLEVDDLEALTAVRESERIFQEQRARGATAFKVEKGRAPVCIDQFDREAEQIVIVPRVVGG